MRTTKLPTEPDAAPSASLSSTTLGGGLWAWLNRLGSPPIFWAWSLPWQRTCLVLALITLAIGLYGGLMLAPPDYLQGNSFRIIYIHVPCAYMSMFVFVFMAVQGAAALIWRIKLCEIFVVAAAPTGAIFTAVTLASGMLWGRPTWGTYWTWDARLTSELVLLFLYMGVIALYHSYQEHRAGARAAAVLSLIGVVNIPIIHYSVEWFSTLHQGQTVSLMGNSKMAPSMLWPLLVLIVTAKLYWIAALLLKSRVLMLRLERSKAWVRGALAAT
jgi:heme exporter protein C